MAEAEACKNWRVDLRSIKRGVKRGADYSLFRKCVTSAEMAASYIIGGRRGGYELRRLLGNE